MNIENRLDMGLRNDDLKGSDHYHVNLGEQATQDGLLGLDCRK